MVGQLGHPRHQVEHRRARHFERTGRRAGTHRQDVVAAIEEGDLAHELGRAEGAFAKPFAGVRIDQLDLAVQHIDEPVHRLADVSDELACGIAALVAEFLQAGDMLGRERDPRHRRQILAKCFHARAPCCP